MTTNPLTPKTEHPMLKIKEEDFNKISPDCRGTWNGKRSVFAGCIMKDGGMKPALEGVDFEVVPTYKRQSRRTYR